MSSPSPRKNLSELVLHPVRLQIIHALAASGELTPHQLAARLPGIAHATLYRHINALVDGKVLRVTGERRVRGAIERAYTLAQPGLVLEPEALAGAGPDDHLRYFTAFLVGLLADFARYVQQPSPDFSSQGAAYRQSLLYLSDDEYREFSASLTALMVQARANPPAPGRRLRRWSMVVIPEAEGPRQLPPGHPEDEEVL